MSSDEALRMYLLLGALLFVCGAVCMAMKRNALGVDRPVRAGAYVATGAMALAFVLSVIGYVLFVQSESHGPGHPASVHATGGQTAHAPGDEDSPASAAARAHDAWEDSITWAS